MTEKKFFYVALVWILLAKLFWIFGPTAAMGIPRLGDDSLVYLWTGASSVVHSQLSSNAIEDILSIRSLLDNPSPQLEFARARITMRVASVIASPYALLTGVFIDCGIHLKYVAAIMEFLVFLVFLGALIFFGLKRFGYGPSAIVLVILSVALLPNQGIHFLVPSVLTMSLALIMYGLILDRGSVLVVFVLSVLMLLIHTIAQIYLLLAMLLLMLTAMQRKKMGVDLMAYAIAMALGCLVWILVAKLTGVTFAKTSGMGGVVLDRYLFNLLGFVRLFKDFMVNQPLLVLLLIYGAAVSAKSSFQTKLLLMTLVGGIFASFLIDIPGYPADLTTRIFVPLSIILFYCAALQIWQKMRIINLRFVSPMVLFLVFVLSAEAKPFFGYFYNNINQRNQIIHEDLMRSELKEISKQSNIIWLDSDIQMLYGLLLGGADLHFIPYSAVMKTDFLRSRIDSKQELLIAAPYPERLNGTSSLKGSYSLRPRFYGYRFDEYKRVSLYFDSPLKERLFIRMDGDSKEFSVISGSGADCRITPLSMYSTWFEIELCSEKIIHIQSLSSEAKLLGFQFGEFNPVVSWPWGETKFRLRAEPINPSHDVSELRFGWEDLLGKDLMNDLSSRIDMLSVKSDQSGVVLVHFIKR